MHAELADGHGLRLGHNTVGLLIGQAGMSRLPIYRRRGTRTLRGVTIAVLVQRNCTLTKPNQRWVMDISDAPTLEGD